MSFSAKIAFDKAKNGLGMKRRTVQSLKYGKYWGIPLPLGVDRKNQLRSGFASHRKDQYGETSNEYGDVDMKGFEELFAAIIPQGDDEAPFPRRSCLSCNPFEKENELLKC